MKILRWLAERVKDLLYGVGNDRLDSGRVIAFLAFAALIGGEIHNIHLKQPIDLGPAGLGGGLSGVLAALVVYIYHDRKGGDNA